LLVASNCTEIVQKDSILLWDKQHEIDLQVGYINEQKKLVGISDTQLRKAKRQIIKYKFGMLSAIILGVASNVYLVFR